MIAGNSGTQPLQIPSSSSSSSSKKKANSQIQRYKNSLSSLPTYLAPAWALGQQGGKVDSRLQVEKRIKSVSIVTSELKAYVRSHVCAYLEAIKLEVEEVKKVGGGEEGNDRVNDGVEAEVNEVGGEESMNKSILLDEALLSIISSHGEMNSTTLICYFRLMQTKI